MSAPRPRSHSARALLLGLVRLGMLLLASACAAGQARPAPFRVRPDSVDPGSLRGPFDGKVIDAASGDAIAGALVYATWSFQSGAGTQEPSGFRESITSTDSSGRYRVPSLDGMAGRGQLADFYLVVYKRGYVAYRSDRRFDDLGPRFDFAQTQNVVRLEKWRSDYSHVRHLRYVGGGPAIAALTRWEAEEAAAELSGVKAGPRVATDLVVAAGGGLAASLVLTEPDIRALTGFDGAFETGPLNDEPDTNVYSSQHFRALGQPESFDLALRVWKLDSATAEERYSELVTTLPAVKEVNEIADRSMRATESQIFGVGFIDLRRGVVVLLTCGQSQCKSMDVLVALGRKAHENIKRMVAEDGGAAGAPPGQAGNGAGEKEEGETEPPAQPGPGLRPRPSPLPAKPVPTMPTPGPSGRGANGAPGRGAPGGADPSPAPTGREGGNRERRAPETP